MIFRTQTHSMIQSCIKRSLLQVIGVASLSLSVLGCSSKHPQIIKKFKDFSLIKGNGINELNGKVDLSEPIIEILFADSSYQEINLKNSAQDFIKKVIFVRTNNSLNYQFVHHSQHMGALYCSFKDSVLKFYSFGMQIGSESGPIDCSLTISNGQGLTQYRFLVKATDTINFIEKMNDFDALPSIQRVDSSKTDEQLSIYNLSTMIKWLNR